MKAGVAQPVGVDSVNHRFGITPSNVEGAPKPRSSVTSVRLSGSSLEFGISRQAPQMRHGLTTTLK
jgi:hypothetical protein